MANINVITLTLILLVSGSLAQQCIEMISQCNENNRVNPQDFQDMEKKAEACKSLQKQVACHRALIDNGNCAENDATANSLIEASAQQYSIVCASGGGASMGKCDIDARSLSSKCKMEEKPACEDVEEISKCFDSNVADECKDSQRIKQVRSLIKTTKDKCNGNFAIYANVFLIISAFVTKYLF